jgi:hypothetical protein
MQCFQLDIIAQWTSLLYLCGNYGHFYIVDSDIYTNNKNGKYCCFWTATVVTLNARRPYECFSTPFRTEQCSYPLVNDCRQWKSPARIHPLTSVLSVSLNRAKYLSVIPIVSVCQFNPSNSTNTYVERSFRFKYDFGLINGIFLGHLRQYLCQYLPNSLTDLTDVFGLSQ